MANARKSTAMPSSELAGQRDAGAAEPLAEVLEIDGQLSDRFQLARAVRVELWIEHDEFVADAVDLNLHAFGATRAEALSSLRLHIVEQRERLISRRDRLSPRMALQADQLEALVLRSRCLAVRRAWSRTVHHRQTSRRDRRKPRATRGSTCLDEERHTRCHYTLMVDSRSWKPGTAICCPQIREHDPARASSARPISTLPRSGSVPRDTRRLAARSQRRS